MSYRFEDEFNNNGAINDRDFLKDEYEQNQSVEYHGRKYNSTPKDEFTSKDKRSSNTKNNENLNKLTEKAVDSSGEAVTVTSSATASGAAAATSSVIVAASTVAVVAIGTVTGISVALHDYDYKFELFSVSANELTYELFIIDNNQKEDEMLSYEDFEHEHEKESEENYPFTLRVYNATYDYSHSLWLGYNYNTFTGLKLGQTYNIVLSESRYGGEVLFEETFKTVATTKFNSFSISGDANFVDKTFDVELDFVDSTNSFSDFTIYLEDAEYPKEAFYTYALEPKSGKQAVNTINQEIYYFDFNRTYNYKFSYKDKGETVDFSSGEVTFTDTSGAVTAFNSFSINKAVDFEGTSFDVDLDFDDPLEAYYSFGLEMKTTSNAYVENSVTLFLQVKTETQNVDVQGYYFDFNEDYDYTLYAYTYNGEEILETGAVDFQDIYNRESRFNGFIFDKTANFKTEEISFALDYVDELDNFDQFVVTFIDENGNEIPIALDKTTEPQLKSAYEYGVSFKLEYTYKLTCLYRGHEIVLDEVTQPFVLTDNYEGSSALFGLMFIGGEAKYSDRSFVVKLDYDDAFDCLDYFTLTLYDEENNTSIDLSLTETDVEQTLHANETMTKAANNEQVYRVDIAMHTITYNVSCLKDNGDGEETIELFDEPQPVSFSNSEFISFEYTGALYQETADDDYSMGMRFNYIDPNDNVYSEWEVVCYDTNNNPICHTNLTNDDHAYEWNNYYLMLSDNPDAMNDIIDNYCTIVVNVNIYDEASNVFSNGVEVYRYENITLKRSEDVDPRIYGITFDDYVAYGMWEFNTRTMVFTGGPDMFTDVQVVIETSDDHIYTYDIDVTNDMFTIFLSQPNEDNFNDDDFETQVSEPVAIKLKYRYYILKEGSDPNDPEYDTSDLIEIICYTDYMFFIAH